MSSQSQTQTPSNPATPTSADKKVSLVGAPTLAILVGCVLAAMGNSRGSALLTWQLPLGLLALSLAYVGVQSRRARGAAGGR